MPEVIQEKCDGCGICVTVCTCKSLVIVNNVITIDVTQECSGCSRWCVECELACPLQAITCPFEMVLEG